MVAVQVGDTIIAEATRGNGVKIVGAQEVVFQCGRCGHSWAHIGEGDKREAAAVKERAGK